MNIIHTLFAIALVYLMCRQEWINRRRNHLAKETLKAMKEVNKRINEEVNLIESKALQNYQQLYLFITAMLNTPPRRKVGDRVGQGIIKAIRPIWDDNQTISGWNYIVEKTNKERIYLSEKI